MLNVAITPIKNTCTKCAYIHVLLPYVKSTNLEVIINKL